MKFICLLKTMADADIEVCIDLDFNPQYLRPKDYQRDQSLARALAKVIRAKIGITAYYTLRSVRPLNPKEVPDYSGFCHAIAETSVITKVTAFFEDFEVITHDFDFTLPGRYKVEPKVGDHVQVYLLGSAVRGVRLNGDLLFFERDSSFASYLFT